MDFIYAPEIFEFPLRIVTINSFAAALWERIQTLGVLPKVPKNLLCASPNWIYDVADARRTYYDSRLFVNVIMIYAV